MSYTDNFLNKEHQRHITYQEKYIMNQIKLLFLAEYENTQLTGIWKSFIAKWNTL